MFIPVAYCLILVGFSLVHGLTTTDTFSFPYKHEVVRKNTLQFDPYLDACKTIHMQLTTAKPKPYTVARVYKMKDDKVLSAKTKVFYTEYRKKPYYEEEIYSTTDEKPDRKVTFIYKASEDESLLQISRDIKLGTSMRSTRTFAVHTT